MTPLVLVAALGAFVHPHSSRDVRPAIVARRVEPSEAKLVDNKREMVLLGLVCLWDLAR